MLPFLLSRSRDAVLQLGVDCEIGGKVGDPWNRKVDHDHQGRILLVVIRVIVLITVS